MCILHMQVCVYRCASGLQGACVFVCVHACGYACVSGVMCKGLGEVFYCQFSPAHFIPSGNETQITRSAKQKPYPPSISPAPLKTFKAITKLDSSSGYKGSCQTFHQEKGFKSCWVGFLYYINIFSLSLCVCGCVGVCFMDAQISKPEDNLHKPIFSHRVGSRDPSHPH